MRDLPHEEGKIRQFALRTVPGFFAFGFGSGLSPYAPGTAGTLAAVPFALILLALPVQAFWIVWVCSFILGVYWCGESCRRLDVHDHGGVVWDEIVAFWLILAFIPPQWPWWLAAFALFRFFDILKPWPIRQFDEKLQGGFGIMLDDILAAAYTLALLVPARHWLGP